MLASDGIFYGMTSAGGANGSGTIFKITTGGAYTVLRHLVNATDGANPEGSLVQGTDGDLYGMTYSNGRIFKITTVSIMLVFTKSSIFLKISASIPENVFSNLGFIVSTP